MLTSTLWAVLLFPGCDGGDTTDTDKGTDQADADADADADTDADSDSDADTDTDADADVKDARDDMVRDASACQNIGGSSTTQGAQVWYWAEVTKSGATWSGEEAWYYYVNDAWAGSGGSDCAVVWDITAAEGSVGSCAGCDLGLKVTAATVDAVQTTCPSDAYDYYTVTDEEYAVERKGSGDATWYFLSGSSFGAGYWAGDTVNYLSNGGCEVRSF